MKKWLCIAMVFGLSCGVYAEIEEARIDVHNTVPEVCGDGGGLNPCRDVDGETFEQELDVNTTPGLDSNQQLEAQVEKLKHESLEREIEELERR